MIRGTTAQFKFKLPYAYTQLEWITIKFWQPGNVNLQPITKNKTHCSPIENTNEICVSLLATETAQFSDRFKAKMQLRAQPAVGLGSSFGSKEQLITVYPMLDDIINDDTTTEPSVPTNEGWVIFDGDTII